MAIRLDSSDMAMIEEVSKASGYTHSDAVRMLIRLGFNALANQMGTPPIRGGTESEASNRASGEVLQI